MPDEL